jgi:cyclopropane fatty-acyl-phospholipid synthase-like methyltransferase
MIAEIGPLLGARGTAVEIGCGVGRVAIPMAGLFQRVVGVDVAPTMLRRLSENCRALNAPNVEALLADEAWESRQADLIYSLQVFQHIEDFALIEGYFRRIASGLAVGGLGYLQFDTRPATVSYRLRRWFPDGMLPRAWRRSIRRTRRDRTLVLERLRHHGLDVIGEFRADTAYQVFVVRSRDR